MRTKPALLWGSAALLLLATASCAPRWIWGPRLAAAEVRPRDLVQTLVVSGRVLAPRRVQVGAQLTGLVARRRVEEGDRVAAGQVLLELDAAEYEASLAQAEARLAQVREVVQPAARAGLAQAESTLRQALWLHERNERLAREGILAPSQLEDSRRALDLARAAQASAQAQDRSALAGSDLRLAEANVAYARAKLAQTRILAPSGGVVLARSVEAGDQVQPGKTLFTLVLDEPLQILIQPDERHLAQLRPGQEALAGADAFPDRPFPARVSYVAPGVDVTRGTVDVKLTVGGEPDFLRPDMTVSVEIRHGKRTGALAVPLQALRSTVRPSVLVLRGGRAVAQPVRLGQRGEREVEVLEGLAAGDRVLLDPAAREGQRCRARLEQAP